jgi:sterol desaturase/sphingolipid hydroxylase (fatty acid hydroxylase superfamily)
MQSLLLMAISQRVQNSALILGIFGIIVGVLLMRGHQAVYIHSLRQPATPVARNYEARKVRRRTIIAGLVTSVGCMLAAIYWVRETKVLAIFTLLIICQLLFILGIATIDFLSVSMRMISKPTSKSQRELLEEFLRDRKETREQNQKPENKP